MNNTPMVPPDLVSLLEKIFKPVTNTMGVDIREIDYKSGQYSVVEYLKVLAERQRNGNERT